MPGMLPLVEEGDHAGLERVLRADDAQAVFPDQPLEQLGSVPEVVDRDADVGADRLVDERLPVDRAAPGEQRLDRGTDQVDDGAKVHRLARAAAEHLVERGDDGAALGMAHHDDEARPEACRRELDAADLRGGDDVPGDADHEKIAEALVEHELGRDARVGAPEDDRERLLAGDEGGAMGRIGSPTDDRAARDEPAVSVPEANESLVGTEHSGTFYFSFGGIREAEQEEGSLEARMSPLRLRSEVLFAAVLAAITLVAYLPAIHGGFVWDDDAYVSQNPLLTADDGLRRIWFSTDQPSQYFPLVYTTFRVEHAIWGLDPTGYHVTNILLHVVNALLIAHLLARLKVPHARLAAAVFALHPVQVESVAWITERKNVLMTVLLALSA